jgi:transposase
MADGGDGFVGCVEVVRRTRGYRRWPEAVKARIVAESFRPGARVVDVARRHEIAPHQLSDWRRQARQGLLALPAEVMDGLADDALPAFVPVAVDGDDAEVPSVGADGAEGVVGIELGCGLVVRVPCGVSAERAAALVRALRGTT